MQPSVSEVATGTSPAQLLVSSTFGPTWWYLSVRDHWGSDSVKKQWCIGHLTLAFGHLTVFCFLIRNVFLVDVASWVSLLNMRDEVSPTILVEETFMTFFGLMCNFMEMVYRTWGNRLRIHQVLGSLKLIRVEKTSNLFLITFFHVKCLLLSSLSPSRIPTRKRLVERWND